MIAAALFIMLGACAPEPVAWKEISYAAPSRPSQIPLGTVQPGKGGCPVSIRAIRAGGGIFAAWWSVRPDSSAILVTGKSLNGGATWESIVTADFTDHSVRGCGRPAPAIAVDSASGYLDLAYFAEPSPGAGIFFSHSMDGGRSFHSAVPIVFGDNPSSVGIAVRGDRVAVVYEDPNSQQPSVGIALSQTMGHIFEHRDIISSDNERARQPAVELRGDTVRVWWSDHSADPRISATRSTYREGIWLTHHNERDE